MTDDENFYKVSQFQNEYSANGGKIPGGFFTVQGKKFGWYVSDALPEYLDSTDVHVVIFSILYQNDLDVYTIDIPRTIYLDDKNRSTLDQWAIEANKWITDNAKEFPSYDEAVETVKTIPTFKSNLALFTKLLPTFHDIFNTYSGESHRQIENTDVGAHPHRLYMDITKFSDAELHKFFDLLVWHRSRAEQNSSKVITSSEEIATLHQTAVLERSNRKRSRLAAFVFLSAIVIAFLHIIFS